MSFSGRANGWPRRHGTTRSPSAGPRIIYRYVNPLLPEPRILERRERYDGPTSLLEDSQELVRIRRSRSRSTSRELRVVPIRPRRFAPYRNTASAEDFREQRRSWSSYHERPGHDPDQSRGRHHRRDRSRSRSRYRSRSRSRSLVNDGEKIRDHRGGTLLTRSPGFQELGPRLSWVARAPTPPARQPSSSLGYIDSGPAGAASAGLAPPRGRRRFLSRRRRPSRSRSSSESRRAETFLRPGDDITVIESDRPASQGDYDCYDKDGMRIRVREI